MAAGLGASALPITLHEALADVRFVNFAFPTTGAPTARTMPDRLAEIKNVKDFGAVGDGSNDDTTSIQAAIDWTAGANRGIIFFPLGNYKTTSSLTLNYNGNLSIAFVGVAGTSIIGNFNDYVFKRSLGSPNNTIGGRSFERLNIQNSGLTGGGIQLGSTDGAYIRDCTFDAHICFTAEDSAGNSSKNILFENVVFTTQGTTAGSHGAILGGGGAMMGCDCHSADTAFRIYGNGFQAYGNRTELSNTAWLIGLDSAGTDRGASGFSIVSGTCEGNGTSFDLAGTCTGFVIGPYGAQGHDKSNSGYPLNTTNSQYGMRIRAGKASAGVINSFGASSWFDQAAISVENASARANLVLVSCSATQSGGSGVAWGVPTNAQTAVFLNSNTQPIWTFSQLPTGGNLLEGDEFDISDSTTATWGGAVSVGGGSNRVRVRYNGTNFTVMGK